MPATAPLPLSEHADLTTALQSDADQRARRVVEAVLFASPQPLTVRELQAYLPEGTDDCAPTIPEILAALQHDYQGRGIILVQRGEAWAFRTAPDLAPSLRRLSQPRRKIPRVAAEVLAIVAYHQPVTRAEIESIRGVATGKGALDFLLELGWIRPGGRRETPGRPLTWKTTPAFLDQFGLESLRDLPGLEELKASGMLDARPVLSGLLGDDESTLDEETATPPVHTP